MRLKLFAAILALLPMPALADVTARYAVGKEIVLVEADDSGNSRIGIDGKFAVIRRDGKDYVTLTGADGQTKVTELAKLLVFAAAAMAGAEKDGLAEEADMKFVMTAGGEVVVGARKGNVWNFGPDKEKNGEPGKMLEIVISDDPALAPIGAIVHRMIEVLQPLFKAVAPESNDFFAKSLELSSKGAPLRIDKAELQSVDTAEIDAKRFELPAPLIDAADWLSMMEPNMQQLEIKPLP